MGRRTKVEGKRATLFVLLFAIILLWAAVRMVPGLASSLGIRGGHEFTFLRWGSMYTEAQPGAWLWGSPKRRSSLAFASAGETIRLDSRSSVERGRVMLAVYSGAVAGPEIHSEHITSSGASEASVTVPATGFYRITANYVFTFRGRHDLDWRVD